MFKNIGKVLILLILHLGGCSNHDNKTTFENLNPEKLPEHVQELGSLTAFSIENKNSDTVEFVQEDFYGNSEDIFLEGYINEVAVDDNGQVYIAVSKPGTVGIYLFNPDGSFRTKFLREGRGPGEFEGISSLLIENNRIYIYGSRLQKVGIFSLQDYSLINDYIIDRSLVNDFPKSYRVTGIVKVYDDETMLVQVKDFNLSEPKVVRYIRYYKLSSDAVLQPNYILKQEATRLYKPATDYTSEGYVRSYMSMPFTPSPLLNVYKNSIYTAQSDQLLIKEHDRSGAYQQAFHYNYKKSLLSISENDFGSSRMQLINENSDQVPDTWPAIHMMVIDDIGRFWILAITDSKDSYKGLVLNNDGAMQAEFEWPGQKIERNAIIPPIFIVKDDFLYIRQRDLSEGIDRIVKYRIEFKER